MHATARRNPAQQAAGFTLVEIAIVLVIIGLLLGGVLKGQEMIDNAKAKSAVTDLAGVQAAYHGYIDRFRRLPGDDGPALATLQGRGGAWSNITQSGDNDGNLEITAAEVFSGGGEATALWQHLKAAGYISGNPADENVAALPRNPFNGLLGVGAGTTNMAGTSLCLSQVPGKSARQIDTQLDDGNADLGSVRATEGVVGVHTAPGAEATQYNDDNVYTVCQRL